MLELIGELLGYIIVEVIKNGLLKIAKRIGLVLIKLLSFSKKSVDEIEKDYKGLALPYFVGAGGLVGLVYGVFQLMN